MNKKKWIVPLSMVTIIGFSLLLGVDEASAAWDKAGITPDGDIDNSGIYDDLSTLVTFVMTLGGFWILGCLVFAGAKLSGAQNNPQNRTAGFIGIGMAFIGGWVIMKAYDIAGWIAGFGA